MIQKDLYLKECTGLIKFFGPFSFFGLILVSFIFLSGAVSAANVATMSQTQFHHSGLNNVQYADSLPQMHPNKVSVHAVSSINLAGEGNAIIGRLKIPRLGVGCYIRSETVNAYNAAYHYPESVAIGQSGECGLMSHRTTYSALFRHLDWLKIGDKVILTDLKRTKYTYSVTSNGNDIRWDYKTNPIQFSHSGPARLLLVTCHPPGYEKAAFITHSKLVSVDYIPRVIVTAPQNLKTSTNRTSTIAVKFSEKIKNSMYYSYIKVKNLNRNYYVPITKFINGNMLYIKTLSKRSPYTWYQVIIPFKSIKDYTNNYLSASYTFKFKTGI